MPNTTILFKRGKAYSWKILNPILQAGEPGFEIDTNRFKIGDGITHWNGLDYINNLEENAIPMEQIQKLFSKEEELLNVISE